MDKTGVEKRLTPKQTRFVEEYLIDLNAAAAAVRAGYSAKTAKEIGCENLTKPNVAAAVQKALAARSKQTEITAEMVLTELARIGFSNMAHYAKWNPDGAVLFESDNLTDDAARCVAEVSQTVTAEGGTVKFKLHDKVAALEKIGRHLGMFKEKVEITGKNGGPAGPSMVPMVSGQTLGPLRSSQPLCFMCQVYAARAGTSRVAISAGYIRAFGRRPRLSAASCLVTQGTAGVVAHDQDVQSCRWLRRQKYQRSSSGPTNDARSFADRPAATLLWGRSRDGRRDASRDSPRIAPHRRP
jgi:phage terminase small subunit